MKYLDRLAGSIARSVLAGTFAAALVSTAAVGQAGAQPGAAADGQAGAAAGAQSGAGTGTGVVAKADPAKGEKIATQVCAACHGPDGNSTAPVNPKLASQHPAYLEKQLADFKVKEGAKTPARPSPVMTPFAAPLTMQDMHDLSAFYGAKELKPSAARQKELVDLGRNIYRGGIADKGVPACAGCHGPSGSGIPSQYPRLAGQFSDYTEAQLMAFRGGQRSNNASMATIASRLSDREIKAVSDYMAGLR